MTRPARSETVNGALTIVATLGLSVYFTFHAVQGEFGLFSRMQIEAEEAALMVERDALRIELAALQNKTRRLSDQYLDLDLLDERARDILGHARSDEVILP